MSVLFTPAQPGAVREMECVAEERLSPGSDLVAALLWNVQLHSAIFSLRIKIQLFSLTGRE